jgi:transposase-like protein
MREMDTARFIKWLAGMEQLDPTQRDQALRELALVQANDSIASSNRRSAGLAAIGVAEDAPSISVAKTVDAAPDEILTSKTVRGRIPGLGCPHCGRDDVRSWGKAHGRPRYRCANCRKTFNPLTGTQLAGLHYQDRWRDQAQALINGESLARAAERCNVDITTAFRWRHKFLSALNLDKSLGLSALLNAEEAFILQSFENNRSAKGRRSDLPKISLKRRGKARNPVCR